MDTLLEERQVRRVYDLYSPVYDLIFKRIFEPGRSAALRLLAPEPGQRVLEVGIGTGLNLPYYPPRIRLVGIDLSEAMLRKARARLASLPVHATLLVMDASAMEFRDNTFDHALATYVISAVPDPVGVLREMRRVTRPGGRLVILNHFRSENPFVGKLEDVVAPVCTHLGWKSNLPLEPLLREVGLTPEVTGKVNLLGGWRLVQCVNRK